MQQIIDYNANKLPLFIDLYVNGCGSILHLYRKWFCRKTQNYLRQRHGLLKEEWDYPTSNALNHIYFPSFASLNFT